MGVDPNLSMGILWKKSIIFKLLHKLSLSRLSENFFETKLCLLVWYLFNLKIPTKDNLVRGNFFQLTCTKLWKRGEYSTYIYILRMQAFCSQLVQHSKMIGNFFSFFLFFYNPPLFSKDESKCFHMSWMIDIWVNITEEDTRTFIYNESSFRLLLKKIKILS